MPKIATTPRAAKAPKAEALPVVHEEVLSETYPDGLPVNELKILIGWEEEPEGGSYGGDYDLEDANGKKVRLTRNVGNRPLNSGWAEALAQKLLRKRWKFNGETIIVGRHGNVLSAQHRICGAVLAEQIRTGPQAKRWAKTHKGPITLPTVLVVGISEDPDTVNTLDLVRPRTLADILYRSHWFSTFKTGDRKKAAGVLSWAVKVMLKRALGDGSVHDVDYRLSPEEGVAFCETHPRLVRLVKHVLEEDVTVDGEDADGNALKYGALSRWVKPGNLSALAYLMAAAGSDGEAYRRAEVPNEKKLDLSGYDKAEEFVTLLADASKNFPDRKAAFWPVLSALQTLHGTRGGRASNLEVIDTLIQAWKLFAAGAELQPHLLTLDEFLGKPDPLTDVRPMVEHPTLGGIDMGEPGKSGAAEEGPEKEGADDEDDADEGEPEGHAEANGVEERKKAVKKESLLQKRHSEREGNRVPKPDGSKDRSTMLASVRKHPALKGRLPLFAAGAFWKAFQGDAETLAASFGVAIGTQDDVPMAQVPLSKLDAAVKALREAGAKPVLVEPEEATGDLLVTVPPE